MKKIRIEDLDKKEGTFDLDFIDSSYDEGLKGRISSTSRVNFSKLNDDEKNKRFRNMQKKIQRLWV